MGGKILEPQISDHDHPGPDVDEKCKHVIKV